MLHETLIIMEDIVLTDINKTGGTSKVLEIFVGARVVLRSNIDVNKGWCDRFHNGD